MAAYVTIAGLRLDIPGFCIVSDLTPLLRRGRNRGSNYTAHGVAGTTFRPKVRDEMPVLLQVLVFSDNDHTGAAHSSPRVGFRANYDHIYDTLVAGSSSALVPLTLTLDDGSTLTADVECPSFEVTSRYENTHDIWAGPLEIVIPAGQLT